MRTEEPSARSFDGTSSVTTYWLARCEGFQVRAGGKRGVVETVALETLSDRASYLIVRFAGRRRHMITPDLVRAVVPAEELLVLHPLESRPSRLAPAARRAHERGARVAEAGARASATATSAAARVSGSAASSTWRGTARASSAVWLALRRLDAWLAPRTEAMFAAAARAGSAAWRETVRAALVASAAVQRFGRWISPRAAAASRVAGDAIRAAAVAIVTAAMRTARRIRAGSPPSVRDTGRRTVAVLSQARAWLAGAERPGPPGERATPQERGREDAGDDSAPERAA